MRGLLLALAMMLSLGAPAFGVSDPGEMLPNRDAERRAEQIGHQLRCLVCQNESIEESEADLARDLRRIIRQRVAEGQTDQQVMDWVIARYGDFVRLRPAFNLKTVLLWGSPALALFAGALAALLLWRRPKPAPAPLSAEERRRLDDLLRS